MVQTKLKEIIYISTAIEGFKVEYLLDESRRNNKHNGITGLLLFNGFMFMQQIEGDPDRINSLFASILKDGRHKDIEIHTDQPLEQRKFSNWYLKYNYCTVCKSLDKQLQLMKSLTNV